jgi:hypothetical protein
MAEQGGGVRGRVGFEDLGVSRFLAFLDAVETRRRRRIVGRTRGQNAVPSGLQVGWWALKAIAVSPFL